MPLAFYSVAATRDFWTEHWGGHSIAELLESAARSPLTRLVLDALPAQGRLLEAGCGPGHRVILSGALEGRHLGSISAGQPSASAGRRIPTPR